jgi:hypothetical protein
MGNVHRGRSPAIYPHSEAVAAFWTATYTPNVRLGKDYIGDLVRGESDQTLLATRVPPSLPHQTPNCIGIQGNDEQGDQPSFNLERGRHFLVGHI